MDWEIWRRSSTTYGYDNAGNVISRTDNRGITTTNWYDALNRLVQTAYSDGTPTATFGYHAGNVANSLGHLTSVANGNSTTNYTSFDSMGNVLASNQITTGWTYSFSYTYNLAGGLASETYPSGRVVNNGYDAANRVNAVTGLLQGQTKNYASPILYWPHGGLYYYGAGNGVTPAWYYNSRLQMSDIWARVQNDDNRWLLDMHNFWGTSDNNGNLQAVNEGYGNSVPFGALNYFGQTYTYDSVNRLSSGGDAWYSRSFNYDQYGNMWVTGNSGVPLAGNTPTSNVYNGNNQIIGVSYDAAGNQLVVNSNTLTYDAENRQISATEPPSLGGATETYAYDGNGQRVQKSISGGASAVYVYDAFGQLAAEYSTAPNNSSCITCYPVWDHLGTPRLVTDENANVVARHDYLPFGEEI